MNYTDEIITNYKQKIHNINSNMNKSPIFPDRREPTKYLSIGYELILKMTFKLRVCFLEEAQFIFAFCYSKGTFEKMIIELENMGYIESSVSKDYGKYWCLTKEALFYIYKGNADDDIRITEDKLPSSDSSKLYFLKVVNGYFAQTIFKSYVYSVWVKYKAEEKSIRNIYCKKQYINQMVYNTDDNSGYSKTKAENFTLAFLPILESDEEEKAKYRDFISKLKSMLSDDLVKFSFLKDFYNQLGLKKETSLENTLTIINYAFNNYYRDTYYTYRQELYRKSKNFSALKGECELFTLSELIKIMKLNKKSLLNTKLEAKTEDELLEIYQKISDIDKFIETYTPKVEELEEAFLFMVFDKYNENDVAMYKEATITLDVLRNNNIYITNIVNQGDDLKPKIHFAIFQSSAEEMPSSYIFTRLEKIFRYYQRCLLPFDFEITIYTYTNQHKELIETKLKSIKESFSDLTEYCSFLSYFDTLKVVSTKNHFQERYKIFEQFKS